MKQFNESERRRSNRPDQHETTILATLDGKLQVRCKCGLRMGKRYEDSMVMSLGDIMEIIRMHHTELDRGQ